MSMKNNLANYATGKERHPSVSLVLAVRHELQTWDLANLVMEPIVG